MKKPPTQTQLARKLGVSPKLISAHVRSGKAPALSDTKAWKVFLASIGRTGSMPKDQRLELAIERVRIARVTAERLELDHKAQLGQMISVDEVRRQILEGENFYFQSLERLLREGPRTLLGLDAPQLRDALAREVHEIREGSRERFQKVAGLPYVRRPYAATRQRFTGPGWTHGPSCNQVDQLDAIVARTGCSYPESEQEMAAMLAAVASPK